MSMTDLRPVKGNEETLKKYRDSGEPLLLYAARYAGRIRPPYAVGWWHQPGNPEKQGSWTPLRYPTHWAPLPTPPHPTPNVNE